MADRLPLAAKEHLAKARESCLGAVAAYNNPTFNFRTASYIVLMIIAWTSLFHAIFYRDRISPWRVKSGTGTGTRYERMGGDYVHWNLTECLNRYYGDEWNPTRHNLRFLIGLRDRIEHRNMPALDHEVFGECQAALFNFERVLEAEFGEQYALNVSLAFSLQFSGINPDKRVKAMRALRHASVRSVVDYVRTFRSELTPDVANDQEFSCRYFLIPQSASHRGPGTLAVEFLPIDQADERTLRDLDRAIILLRPRSVPMLSGRYLPRQVVDKVAERIPWRFRLFEHQRCWRHFNVRPPATASDPTKTDDRYCFWDPVFKQHVYTDGWVKKLVTDLQDETRFQEIVGQAPVLKLAPLGIEEQVAGIVAAPVGVEATPNLG